LVARVQISGGPDLYGFLLGAIGAAAVAASLALPWLKSKLGADRLVAVGNGWHDTNLATLLFGLARSPAMALSRRERVAEVRRWLSNYQELKGAIEAVCELNHDLLRPERTASKPRRKRP
jgi:hypothetical protein